MEHGSGKRVLDKEVTVKTELEVEVPSKEVSANYIKEEPGLGQSMKIEPASLVEVEILEDCTQGTSALAYAGSGDEGCSKCLGDLLNVKDEPSDMDVGPTVLQHMDIHYKVNQNTSAVKKENTAADDCDAAIPCKRMKKESLEDKLKGIGEQRVVPAAGRTHVARDSVECQMKEEGADLDIGATVLQHMDLHYRTDQIRTASLPICKEEADGILTPGPASAHAEAADLCAQEVEDMVATNEWHLWLQPQDLGLAATVNSLIPITNCLDNPKAISDTDGKLGPSAIAASFPIAGPSGSVAQPEPTVGATNTLGQANDGSDMDTEFDEEFDIGDHVTPDMNQYLSRNIPVDAELDAPVRTAIRNMEEVMDANQENLLGVNNRFDWAEDFSSFRGRREQFVVASPGPTEMFDTAYKSFVAIWHRDFMEGIARETNRYAKQVLERKTEKGEIKTTSRLHVWKETNVEELYAFFAVLMYMELDQRIKIDEYWRTDSSLEMPRFRQLMSYNRYSLLNKFLHFVDNSDVIQSCLHNEGTQLSPKLYKIAPVIHHLNSKFQSLYVLEDNIAINESLTLFRGRLSWIQSIRTKAGSFGIKSFELCESNTGYLHKFIIYTGKDSHNPELVMHNADLGGKSTLIVLDLLKGLEHKGYRLTMDNFYNSPSLARYLKSLGFDCVGTLRANRKHVPEAIAKLGQTVAKGTVVARHCGDVSVLAWKDVEVVNMISTYHDATTFVGSKAGKALVKPVSVRDYQNTMGGVDLKDQKLSKYVLERRGVKWYMKIFKRLMNASIVNAYILCRHSWSEMDRRLLTHREFRYQLADELTKFHNVNLVARSITNSTATRLRKDIVHEPQYISGSKKRRRCPVCSATGQLKKVLSACVTCDVGLCFKGCWAKYHSVPDLKALSKY